MPVESDGAVFRLTRATEGGDSDYFFCATLIRPLPHVRKKGILSFCFIKLAKLYSFVNLLIPDPKAETSIKSAHPTPPCVAIF